MTQLYDNFGRHITYLRLSVTDRCDFRCVYCMSEEMTFLPRQHILTLEEMTLIAQAFCELGIVKIRITGGEPLIRRNIEQLLHNISAIDSLDELTITTNGSQLLKYAQTLADNGIQRINVSLDSLETDRFAALTRTGRLSDVLQGIEAARNAGLHIKLNSVILKNRNSHEVINLVAFALQHQMDISFIEEMPLGIINDHQRQEEFVSSADLRQQITAHYPLTASDKKTGGPSRYWQVESYHSHIGFISPHSDNFCASCNRLRVTAEGKLLLCLGNENHLDLRAIVRNDTLTTPLAKREQLKKSIIAAVQHKPEKHHFDVNGQPEIVRFMNMTGG